MNINSLIHEIFSRVDSKIDDDDVNFAKRAVTDSIAAFSAGVHQSRSLLENLYHERYNNGSCASLNDIDCLILKSLIVGTASHSAELDDGVISGIIHPGSPIVSTLMCYGTKNVDSKLFYKAIIIGYEVCTLLSEAIQPAHKKLGYHATATCGLFGAITALSVINNHDIDFCIKALNIGANYSFGSISALKGESNLKAVNVGFTSQVAISTYMLALSGFNASDDAFWGKFGFFDRMYSLAPNFDGPLSSEKLAISRVYNKPYASCRYCHPAIDCIFNILLDNQIIVSEIKYINLETYGLAIENHDHTDVKNVSSAKMSIPFSVATVLINHSAGLKDYELASISKVLESRLMDKIKIEENSSYSELFPRCESASVTLTLKNGAQFSSRVDQPLGSTENPMEDEAIRKKLIDCFEFSKTKNANKILNMLWDDETINIESILASHILATS